MPKPFFIAGTDTDVGKTLVACALLEAAAERDLTTLGLKPVAAGAEMTAEGLRNDDALLLASSMTEELPYQQLNPVCFEPAIAPHLAAEQAGRRVTVAQLSGFCRGALMRRADFSVIEGAGGWLVPLNHSEVLAQLAIELQTPVIMVVGIKLGCLNHALLTATAIKAAKLNIAGWVANTLDPDMDCLEDNIATLERMLSAPCLGRIPRLPEADPKQAASYLNIDALLAEEITA